MKRSLAGACVALGLALSACGTTVPLTQQVMSGTPGVDGSGALAVGGASGSAVRGGTPPQSGGPLGTGTTGSATGSATSGTTGGSAPGPGTSDPVGTTVKGRGLTATTLTIGIPVPGGQEALASSLGIAGAGMTVTPQDAARGAAAHINRTGGVLGRTVKLYFHEFDTAAYVANPAQITNEICTDFRDDHPVFAVLFQIPTKALRECLAAMGTPLIGGSGSVGIVPAEAYEHRGGNWFYAPNAITVEALAKVFIESLVQRDFHRTWDTAAGTPGGIAPVKLGVIHADTPDAQALYAAYERELRKHGLRYTDHVTYSGNVQAGIAASQNAVLKFRADGITHVYGASAFFLQAAENQGYRPRYAYLPGLGALGAANVPARQMRGALTVGWTPSTDVNQNEDPGDTPGAADCRAVMKRAALRGANRNDEHTMRTMCDLFSALRAALVAGGTPTVAGLRRGFEALGSSLRPALTFTSVLGPGRHYGVTSVRDMAYDTRCSCLKYTSRTDRR